MSVAALMHHVCDFSNRCLHCLYISRAIEINVYEIAFAEIVVAILEKIVLSEALLEANALILIKLPVSHSIDVEGSLAEGDGVAQFSCHLSLLNEFMKFSLCCNLLYHYF